MPHDSAHASAGAHRKESGGRHHSFIPTITYRLNQPFPKPIRAANAGKCMVHIYDEDEANATLDESTALVQMKPGQQTISIDAPNQSASLKLHLRDKDNNVLYIKGIAMKGVIGDGTTTVSDIGLFDCTSTDNYQTLILQEKISGKADFSFVLLFEDKKGNIGVLDPKLINNT
jgi:hypothetical protein